MGNEEYVESTCPEIKDARRPFGGRQNKINGGN